MFDKYKNTHKNIRSLYRELRKGDYLLQDKCEKFQKYLIESVNLSELIKMINTISLITISVKLRSFQYKIFTKALVLNTHLKMYGVKESDLCSFCQQQRETLDHSFFTCTKSSNIWIKISESYDMRSINVNYVLCNNYNRNPKHPHNCIILIVKYYLYQSRCMNERISFESCINFINMYINAEEEIAKSKNKLAQHKKKWSNL